MKQVQKTPRAKCAKDPSGYLPKALHHLRKACDLIDKCGVVFLMSNGVILDDYKALLAAYDSIVANNPFQKEAK